MSDGIKRVDEDWKKQAREEREKIAGEVRPKQEEAAAGGGAAAGTTDPKFLELIQALATEALMFLGAIAHPQTGQAVFAPDQAKRSIDYLHILEQKTKGNLSQEEADLLKNANHELRIAYVEASKKAPPPAEEEAGN